MTAQMITVQQAIQILDDIPLSLAEHVLASVDAVGSVLAEDISADRDAPPFDKSLMDGFAVRASDATAGRTLKIIGEIAAGNAANIAVTDGNAVSIMTGAPLPAGTQVVVPVEATSYTDDTVTINEAFAAGYATVGAGHDVKKDQIILPKGTTIGPVQLSVLASVGKLKVRVYRAPTFSVLATGSELIAADKTPLTHQIRESNNPMLINLLERQGCRLIKEDMVGDDPKKLREAISNALQADFAFISGGMSMGKHDHVPALLRDLGVDLKIEKIRIRPGKPFVFGTKGTRNPHYVFGLPGNPVSGFVCTLRLAMRMIRRVQGLSPEPTWIDAPCSEAIMENGPREFYQPAILSDGKATLLPWKGSADLFTLARANALAVRPENDPAKSAGAMVRLMLI